MFATLSQRLSAVFDRLKKRGALSETDVSDALREIRVALLEADVALPVVKTFIGRIKEKAVGQDVLRSITPGQMVVKIVYDELVRLLGKDSEDFSLSLSPPTIILMAGLQGSGKTTTTAKLALHFRQKRKKKVLMVSTDVYRPSAREQLAILGRQIQVDTVAIEENENPLSIAKGALMQAKREGYDVLLVDTAGRLHTDNALMEEIQELHTALNPHHILLVVDAMMGQDTVRMASSFGESVPLTGLILTRLDGDARGGAALSIREVTGCPIQFIGIGEKVDQLEAFQASRLAGRILDMGDVVSLVEKTSEMISQEDAQAMASKMQKGTFDMDDLAAQLMQLSKMGGMGSLLSMMPGMGKLKSQLPNGVLDDGILKRQLAIIRSMTRAEKKNVKLLNASRRQRIAQGSGTSVQDINRLIKNYTQMADMMKKMSRIGSKGLMRGGLQRLLQK
jgi:signal recognition particle subunit SRP54